MVMSLSGLALPPREGTPGLTGVTSARPGLSTPPEEEKTGQHPSQCMHMYACERSVETGIKSDLRSHICLFSHVCQDTSLCCYATMRTEEATESLQAQLSVLYCLVGKRVEHVGIDDTIVLIRCDNLISTAAFSLDQPSPV